MLFPWHGSCDDHGTDPTTTVAEAHGEREQEEMSVVRNGYVLTAPGEFTGIVQEPEHQSRKTPG